MNDAERGIAVLDRVDDDPDRKEIIDLVERLALIHHLLVDAEEVLHASVHLGLDAGLLHLPRDFLCDLCHILLPLALPLADLLHQIVVDIRLEIFERQIIQFHLDAADSEPLGDRRVNIKRLLRNPLLLLHRLMRERPHIVQPVRQLDQNDADVLRHGEKHFPQIERLIFQLLGGLFLLPAALIIILGEFKLGELCHAIDKKRHIRAKIRLDLFPGEQSILHHIVQKTSRNRLLVHFQIGQNDCDIERMNDIGFAGLAQLPLVRLVRGVISLFNQRDVVRRVIFAHPLDQILIQHIRRDILRDALDPAVVKPDSLPSRCRVVNAAVERLDLTVRSLPLPAAQKLRRCSRFHHPLRCLRVPDHLPRRGIHLLLPLCQWHFLPVGGIHVEQRLLLLRKNLDLLRYGSSSRNRGTSRNSIFFLSAAGRLGATLLFLRCRTILFPLLCSLVCRHAAHCFQTMKRNQTSKYLAPGKSRILCIKIASNSHTTLIRKF